MTVEVVVAEIAAAVVVVVTVEDVVVAAVVVDADVEERKTRSGFQLPSWVV